MLRVAAITILAVAMFGGFLGLVLVLLIPALTCVGVWHLLKWMAS
jgi:hypothetical protein